MQSFTVQQFELDLLNPETRKSPERLSLLLADDFFEFTQSGLSHTKQDIIDILPTSPEEIFSVNSYQEKKLSDGIILVHYVADRFVPATGLKRCTLCSSVWKFTDNRWQMIFFQGTPQKQ